MLPVMYRGMSVKREQLIYLSQAEVVAAGLTMAEIIDLLEIAFREKGEGRVEMPPKPGVHPGDGGQRSSTRCPRTSRPCGRSA